MEKNYEGTKSRRPGRLTDSTIAALLSEIEAYAHGERTVPLTWAALTEFCGFSHVSLWKKREIRVAFQAAKAQMRADATPAVKVPKTTDERISAMQTQIDSLREIVRAYDEQWVRYEYNVQRLGIDPEELRRPIDSVLRIPVRSRRFKAVR